MKTKTPTAPFFRKNDGRTPESLIQRIHTTVTDWDPVWASLGVQVPPSGRHGPCPVCGGKDRFRTIPAERGRGGWICNGCGTSGDGLDLVARVHGVPLAEAVHMVADAVGIRAGDDNGVSYQAAIQAKAAQQAERDAQQAEAHARAAALAEQMTLESCTVAADSVPYLARKGFHGLMVQVLAKDYQHSNNGKQYTYKAGSLIVPLLDADGNFTSSEIINADGGKFALAGGRKKGAFGLVPAADGVEVDVVAIVEGYATGLSCHLILEGCPAFCGMSKSGLLDAAKAARKLYPDARIIVCGDAGAEREAEGAAAAVDGEVAIPPDGFGDWDDYRQSLEVAA